MAARIDDPDTEARGGFRIAAIVAIAFLVLFILYLAVGGRHSEQAATEQGANPPVVEQAKPTAPPATP